MTKLPKKSVVVPVDFSEESFAAVDSALEFVDDPSHLHVIHVLRDVNAAELEHIWDEVDKPQWETKARQALEKRLADEKYKGVKLEVVFGGPASTIVQYAQRVNAELIVMPSHGRSGVSRMLLGSVAERVTRLAPCAVLVLKESDLE